MRGARTAALVALVAGLARSVAGAPALSTQDYLDIRALVNTYPAKIDRCTNGGYDYADQYAVDGTFGVSSAWGGPPRIWYRGRDQLADAAGGGPGGCRPDPWGGGSAPHRHISTSLVITPTAGGAMGKSTLLSLGGGAADTPPGIEWQGGYEDRYVRTAQGWRFRSRIHVWPGQDWPDTAAEQQARMKAAREASSAERTGAPPSR